MLLTNHWFTDTYDWSKCLRFSLYGSLFVAPTLYGWVRFTTYVWPASNLRTAMYKSVCEQLSYGPAATASFFFLMSLLEYRTVQEAVDEVRDKFLPTFKVIQSHTKHSSLLFACNFFQSNQLTFNTFYSYALFFQVGCCYWLTVQTFNYAVIPERNRVPFVSLFGLLWTTFLAYMKQRDANLRLEQFEKIQNWIDCVVFPMCCCCCRWVPKHNIDVLLSQRLKIKL